jgi:DNA-binding MarR family transcriptional regulator
MPVPRLAFTDTDYRALAAFRHQLRRFSAFSESAARKIGIEPRQHQLLLAVRGLPPGVEPSVSALAAQLCVRHHTVVELVDRLVEAGLVVRDRSAKDRRAVRLCITERGESVLADLTKDHLDELRVLAPALVATLHTVLPSPRRRKTVSERSRGRA